MDPNEDLTAAIETALARVLDTNGWGIDQTTVPAGWVQIIADAVRPEVDRIARQRDRYRTAWLSARRRAASTSHLANTVSHSRPDADPVETALDTIFQVRAGQPLPHPDDVARTAKTFRRLPLEENR